MRAAWLALVCAIAAIGCERRAVEPFTDLDVDSDNRISREEARADPELAPEFARIDGNRDGELSAREYLEAATDAR